MQERSSLKPWKILKSDYLVQDDWFTLRSDKIETNNGVVVEPFYIVEQSDWVHVVAFNEQGKVLIVWQYRHGAEKVCAELPCGAMDESDTSPLEAIKRELLEETGCVGERFESLETLHPNPARQNNRVHNFIAYNVKQTTKQQLDKTENIEFEFVDIATVFQLIDRGEFSQSMHVASFFMALRKCGLIAQTKEPGIQNENN